MAADDLVSGVLTRISELEQVAEAIYARFRVDPGDESQPNDGVWQVVDGSYVIESTYGYSVAEPRWPGGSLELQHIALHGPASILRLCRAHRDIIDMYVQAKAQPVAESVPHSKGRGLDHASAMGRLTALGLVLQSLARGLGVEETTDE